MNALAPVKLETKISSRPRVGGSRFAHLSRVDLRGNRFNLISDAIMGNSFGIYTTAYTYWQSGSDKAYILRREYTFGTGTDEIGYVLQAQGDTPLKALENMRWMLKQFKDYSNGDLIMGSMDFGSHDWPLDAEFITRNKMGEGKRINPTIEYVLRTPIEIPF